MLLLAPIGLISNNHLGTALQAFLLHGQESVTLRWLPKPVALATRMLAALGEFSRSPWEIAVPLV